MENEQNYFFPSKNNTHSYFTIMQHEYKAMLQISEVEKEVLISKEDQSDGRFFGAQRTVASVQLFELGLIDRLGGAATGDEKPLFHARRATRNFRSPSEVCSCALHAANCRARLGKADGRCQAK